MDTIAARRTLTARYCRRSIRRPARQRPQAKNKDVRVWTYFPANPRHPLSPQSQPEARTRRGRKCHRSVLRSHSASMRVAERWLAASLTSRISKPILPKPQAGIATACLPPTARSGWQDRESVVSGKSGAGRYGLGGCRIIETKKQKKNKK